MLANAGSDTSVPVNKRTSLFRRSTQVMAAGIPRILMRLLLFSLIVKGSLLFPDHRYDIIIPCEGNLVCLHMWRSAKNFIAVATNGRIQTRSEMPGCRLPVKNQTDTSVLPRFCQKGTEVSLPQRGIPKINLILGKSASLQCVLLNSGRSTGCSAKQVLLRWLDEAGDEIRADSEHQVERHSACNITLTVSFKSPTIKTLKCQATVGQQVRTSAVLMVRVPALRGKGRVLIVGPGPEEKLPETGGYRDIISIAVGVVGCVVFIALVVAFVVRRRRTRNQLPGEPESTSGNNGSHADDVIYADVILPGSSGRMLMHEDTEYACIRRK